MSKILKFRKKQFHAEHSFNLRLARHLLAVAWKCLSSPVRMRLRAAIGQQSPEVTSVRPAECHATN